MRRSRGALRLVLERALDLLVLRLRLLDQGRLRVLLLQQAVVGAALGAVLEPVRRLAGAIHRVVGERGVAVLVDELLVLADRAVDVARLEPRRGAEVLRVARGGG